MSSPPNLKSSYHTTSGPTKQDPVHPRGESGEKQ